MKFYHPILPLLCLAATTMPTMQTVGISPDNHHFILTPSNDTFTPWGHNYAVTSLDNWPKIEADFTDLQNMRANVVRMPLQFLDFMTAPDKINPDALARLSHLLSVAEQQHIYLDITGLAAYRKSQRTAWYDSLSDTDRWRAQSLFWQTIAQQCASSPAVFCYDLINEPIVAGTRKDGWYTGDMGDYQFLQRLSLDQPNRPLDEIAIQWTHLMVAAIRSRDKTHLITIGMLPMWGVSQRAVGPQLDFIAVHIYPQAHKVDDALTNLKQFDIGKPIVVEETFPLSCGVDDERQFLLRSRSIAAGWIGQYPEKSPAELEALKRSNQISIGQSMYLDWINLFKELGPQMLGQK